MIFNRDRLGEPLYVVVPLFNPWRWKSRIKHVERALKHFHDSGAVIILVEAAFNRREFNFQDSGLDGTAANCGVTGGEFRHKYIQFRTKDELWIKENLVNLAVQRLPYNWEQVAWIDGDVHFVRPNWVGECIHQLQHYSYLQMFSEARDLSPDYEMLPENYPHASGVSFIQAWKDGRIASDVDRLEKAAQKLGIDLSGSDDPLKSDVRKIQADIKKLETDLKEYPPARVFPGLAWAATRKAFDSTGGLIDVAVWGGADYHQAFCLCEATESMMREDLHRDYKKIVMQWYERCRLNIRRNVGCMSGTIFHSFHGLKTSRGYGAKHALLAKIGFDPLRHLTRDFQGIWQLNDDRSSAFPRLRDGMRKIAMERDEDSTYTGLDRFTQGH